MIISRGAKLKILLIIMIISIFFTSSTAMGAPYYLPGEIDEKELAPQEEQLLDDGAGQEPENIEEDILCLDGENAIQSETLPLEPIVIPPEPFMGAPIDVPAEIKSPLPQTGARLLYMEAGSLLTIIGIIINGKSR